MALDPRLRTTGAALLAAMALAAAGCGGDDSDTGASEDSVRDCLTEEGLTVEASDLSSSAALGNASPDFRVRSEQREVADVIVEGDEQKAGKTAADIQGATQSFGAAETVVVKERNSVIVFEEEPSGEFRSQLEACVS
jgi:type IV pilus biogenesis protein CpaD/CtpE